VLQHNIQHKTRLVYRSDKLQVYLQLFDKLIKTPGPFTGEALESWQSLEAYNYFMSGHVQ
jgi:hypothetical protein